MIMAYQFIPLRKVVPQVLDYTIGHTMIWRPDEGLKLRLIVSKVALERDFEAVPFSNSKVYQRPGVKPVPHPGYSLREAIEVVPGGVAYFNAGEMGMLNCPLIVDGQLVTKPEPVKALLQKRWEPLNGPFTFFVQLAEGRADICTVDIRDNRLVHPFDKGTYGFSAPYVLKNRAPVPLKNPAPGWAPNGQEVFFPGGKTQAPISAIGLTQAGDVIRISLVGDIDEPENVDRFPTEYDLIHYLDQFDVVDAIYTGASADVQYYDAQTQFLGVGPERPKPADRKWLLREGQSERGLTVIGVLLNASTAE